LAIKGSLVEASLPEVIQLLAYSLKSGCLSVTDGRNFGNIFLKEGRVIYATIMNRALRIGDRMRENELFKQHILDDALRLQKQKKKRIGEILIELGAISRKDLEEQLRKQIEDSIFTMLTWQSGYFNFEENLLPASEEYTIDLSAQGLLLTGARRIQDWQKIESKLPPFETVLAKSEIVRAPELTESEEKILSLVDGANSIDEVIQASGLNFYEAGKAIFILLAGGVIEKPKKPAERKREPGDMSEYKDIGFALYKAAKYDEAEREFKRVLENEPSNAEALFYMGLIEMMRQNEQNAKQNMERALEIEKRISILINLGYLCNRIDQLEDAGKYLGQARALQSENIKVIMNLGVTHYRSGEMEKAGQLFRQSLSLSEQTVVPYIYLSMISIKQSDIRQAVDWLRQASAKFPRVLAFKHNLAVLCESEGEYEEAERLYCQVLAAQPEARLTIRNLATLYYRLGIYGAAREYYEQLPESECDFSTLVNLGNLHLMRGEMKIALTIWERAHELKPNDQDINRNIETLRTLLATTN